MPNNRNFQLNRALGETRKPPDPNFASKIGAKDYYKNFSNLDVGGQAPATPTPPVLE